MRLFDVGGVVAIVGLIVTAVISSIGNTRRLYAAEPLPSDVAEPVQAEALDRQSQ